MHHLIEPSLQERVNDAAKRLLDTLSVKDEYYAMFILSDGTLVGGPDVGSKDHDAVVSYIMKEAGIEGTENAWLGTSLIHVVSIPLQELNARTFGPITERQFAMLKRLAVNKPNIFVDVYSRKKGFTAPILTIDNRAHLNKIEVMEEDERSSPCWPPGSSNMV